MLLKAAPTIPKFLIKYKLKKKFVITLKKNKLPANQIFFKYIN